MKLKSKRMNLTESQLQLFGLAIIFYVVLTIGFNSFFQLLTAEAKKHHPQPIMSLEFVRSAADVEKITGGSATARQGLKTFLLLDSFAFIPLYLGFLLLMSFFFSRSNLAWTHWATPVAVCTAVIAASADFTENFYSYKILDTDIANSIKQVGIIFLAAYIKWIGIFVSIIILSLFFLRGGWWNVATYFLTAASFAGLICLFFYRAGIAIVLIFQLLILLLISMSFMFSSCRLNFLKIIDS